jgi:phosphoenolpyruvate carboxylase
MNNNYEMEVAKRFTIYNSLFLDLPFTGLHRTVTLLPLLSSRCKDGYQKGHSPKEIIEGFFTELMPNSTEEERHNILFQMVQLIERQVVLFDSIEDAAFEKINDIEGKGSVKALISRVDNDQKKNELIEKLKTFSVRLTLTAHPTQFYPGNVLGIITDMESAIRSNDLASVSQLLHQLGKTGFINREKPTPMGEALSLIWYLENVFYKSIPDILIRLLNNLNIPIHEWENPGLLKVGFWPGGDRDGNPYVTHDVTEQVADRLKRWILRCYYRDIRKVRRRLTFRNVEPLLLKIEKDIYNNLFETEKVPLTKESLIDELLCIREIILNDHEGLFINLLDEYILKIRIFGFHFANMDIRQDSRKHEALWEEIILLNEGKEGLAAYQNLNEEQQIQKILKVERLPDSSLYQDDFHQEMINSFSTIERVQDENGEEGLHRYIISNCQSALHIIQVYQLAKLTLGKDKEGLKLDIVPLFETIDDLANASDIMKTLYQNKPYQDHLKSREKKQTIMLGFSDGTKDGGYLRANWSILRAKEDLTNISRQEEVSVVFFDGRGGPPARGGGNMHNFYASLGRNVENEEIQVTIQGQTISANYGKQVSCTYNLEQLLSAGLENHLYPSSHIELNEEQRALMESMAKASYDAYKNFKQHPQFLPYLEHVTPLKYFGQTNIGSRPLKRGKDSGLKFEDLRAIPFVGSWAQMKQNIPGFYGVGEALDNLKKAGKLELVQKFYRESLFFRTLLGNSMQSLAKSYYPSTAYLQHEKNYKDLWTLMFNENMKSVEMLLEVSGMKELLEDNQVSKASIEIREKIVLPLITIQQFCIQSMLKSGEEHPALQKLILRTMFGIINAARNAA